MFRMTRYIKSLMHPAPVRPVPPKPSGPVVIWNLIRRCNLTCKHCYSISADIDFKGELTTQEVYKVMDDLKAFGVPVLILSGGEPLMRPDIFDISHRAKAMGFYVGLSTNGTLITEDNIGKIAEVGYDYVGISIDGLEATHDEFRQKKRRLQRVHARRGPVQKGRHQGRPAFHPDSGQLPGTAGHAGDARRAPDRQILPVAPELFWPRWSQQKARRLVRHDPRRMNLLFNHCHDELKRGIEREYVTGNNDADGPFLIEWAKEHYPNQVDALTQRLTNWGGGNSSGVNISNIDNLGVVHPDTFWWDHNLGNVRETPPFSKIWSETTDPLMQGFRQHPRPVKGRCADCKYLNICNGNTRTGLQRVWRLLGGRSGLLSHQRGNRGGG